MNARSGRPSWQSLAPAPIDGIEPPNDERAERKAINAMLAVRGFVGRVHPPLEPEHFHSGVNREIVRACFATCQDGEVDAVRVIEWLKAEGKLDQVGGPRAIVGPAELSAVEQREALSAVSVVWSLAHQRALALHAQQALAAIYTGNVGGQREFFEQFEKRTGEIIRSATRTSEAASVAAEMGEFIKGLGTRQRPVTIATGLDTFDKSIGEMWLGQFSIVAAASGDGKTAFALGAAVGAAKRKHGVLYASTEMTATELGQRMICAESGVPFWNVQHETFSDEQTSRVTAAADRLAKLPLHLDYSEVGHTVGSVLASARRLAPDLARKGTPLRLLIVDYLQDLKFPSAMQHESEEYKLRTAATTFKNFAQEMNLHVMVLSQLTYSSKRPDDWRPDIPDLAGAKAIARPATSVTFIFRSQEQQGQPRSIAELLVRKARNGARSGKTGRTVIFDGPRARFEDGDPEPEDKR